MTQRIKNTARKGRKSEGEFKFLFFHLSDVSSTCLIPGNSENSEKLGLPLGEKITCQHTYKQRSYLQFKSLAFTVHTVLITRRKRLNNSLNSSNISYLLIPGEIAYNIFFLLHWKDPNYIEICDNILKISCHYSTECSEWSNITLYMAIRVQLISVTYCEKQLINYV